jgi:hypothetical protein
VAGLITAEIQESQPAPEKATLNAAGAPVLNNMNE